MDVQRLTKAIVYVMSTTVMDVFVPTPGFEMTSKSSRKKYS